MSDVIHRLCADLLDQCAAGMDDPPDRQFVTTGPNFAYDCAELVVHFESFRLVRPDQLDPGQFRLPADRSGPLVPVITLRVVVVEVCLDQPALVAGVLLMPTAAAIDAVAARVLTRAHDAWTATLEARRAATLFAAVIPDVAAAGVAVGDLVPTLNSPAGDAVGMTFDVSALVLELAAPPS